MLSYDCLLFDAGQAEALVDLGHRAFSAVPGYARPKDSTAHVGQLLGPGNPAGPTWLATARDGGRLMGSVSATPFRFRTAAGRSLTGFQLGSIAVDPALQRQGLASRLIGELTARLAQRPDSFTYIYPNVRSMPVLLRLGYEAAAAIPTYVHPPALSSLATPRRAEARFVLRVGHGAWDVELVAPNAFLRSATPVPESDGAAAGFVRDAAYCRWRYCGPDTEARYRFAILRSQAGAGTAVAVLASHAFNGIRFTILVDLFSESPGVHYGPAVKAAQAWGRRDSAGLVYSSSNIPVLARLRATPSGTAWGVAVPDFANPRPVKLLLHTGSSAAGRDELATSVALAGDWMAF